MVLLNSTKAAALFEKLDLMKREIPLNVAVRYNKQLSAPSRARGDREELLREFREEPAETIQKRFKRKNKKQILIGRIKYIIPKGLKKTLLKRRYKK